MCHVPLVPKMAEGWGISPLLTQAVAPFALAMPITSRCEQEANTGYFLSAGTSISEGKQEADCKCLD